MKKIYILGAGTYGEVMLELAESCGYSVLGFFDDNEKKLGKEIMGAKVIGKIEELFNENLSNKNFAVAIGNNQLRSTLLDNIRKKGGGTPNLIHPTVYLGKDIEIGEGIYIQPNSTIWTRVKINDNCAISPGVVIAHHTTLGKGSFISTNSGVGANINIGEKVFVGMGATIVTGIEFIGENSIVGAGATVLKNVEKNVVVAGVPAKKIKNLK